MAAAMRSAMRGSPPRVWGRLLAPGHDRSRSRFTPTRVGTTTGVADPEPAGTVHPHACGDDIRVRRVERHPAGSPPRVWGRPRRGRQAEAPHRFTPTRVGTTGSYRAGPSAPPVHPHACGDDAAGSYPTCTRSGSPPRVWGRQHEREVNERSVRFTPTRVGTTSLTFWPQGSISVHPHACGDDSQSTHRDSLTAGSPPRVWGRPLEARCW